LYQTLIILQCHLSKSCIGLGSKSHDPSLIKKVEQPMALEEYETNLMSLVIMFYFTSSMLNIEEMKCFSLLATRIPRQPSHTEIPTHIETRTHE